MPIDINETQGFTGGAYQVPVDKDKGNDVFSTLEDFMNRMAKHSHTGEDSKKITLNFTKEVQDLTIGVNLVWNTLTEGNLETAVTLPLVATHDNMRRIYKVVGGAFTEIFPDQAYVDITTYKITANEAIDLRIIYF